MPEPWNSDAADANTSAARGRLRTHVRRVLAATVAVAALANSGCGTRPPQARVDSMILQDENARQARVLVRLEIANPNDVALPLEEITYSVGDFSGLRRAGITIPPGSIVTLDLPAVVAADRADGTLRASGRIAWVPSGAIARSLHDTGVVRRRAGFGGTGEPSS